MDLVLYSKRWGIYFRSSSWLSMLSHQLQTTFESSCLCRDMVRSWIMLDGYQLSNKGENRPNKDPTLSVAKTTHAPNLSKECSAAPHNLRGLKSKLTKHVGKIKGVRRRGSATIAYTKLAHQKDLPPCSAKAYGFLLRLVFLLAHRIYVHE